MISQELLIQTIAEAVDNEELAKQEITLDSDLFDDLGLTSFDMLMLFFRLEDKFGLAINFVDSQLKTVRDLYQLL